jgi:hypothetical protein
MFSFPDSHSILEHFNNGQVRKQGQMFFRKCFRNEAKLGTIFVIQVETNNTQVRNSVQL